MEVYLDRIQKLEDDKKVMEKQMALLQNSKQNALKEAQDIKSKSFEYSTKEAKWTRQLEETNQKVCFGE